MELPEPEALNAKPVLSATNMFAAMKRKTTMDQAIGFLDSGRRVLEHLFYKVALKVLPILEIPSIMTPEIVQAIFLSQFDEISADDLIPIPDDVDPEAAELQTVLPEYDPSYERPKIEMPVIKYVYSPHDFIKYHECKIMVWLDRFNKACPGVIPIDDDGHSPLEIFRQRGIVFEQKYMEGLRAEYAARGELDKIQYIPLFKDGYWHSYQEYADKSQFKQRFDHFLSRFVMDCRILFLMPLFKVFRPPQLLNELPSGFLLPYPLTR